MDRHPGLRRGLEHWLDQLWYGSRPLARALLYPLSWLFCRVAGWRRQYLQTRSQPFPVPVVVIGNISVGGTGKTPLTMALVALLREQGWHPGIVSRGYGRDEADTLRRVTAATPVTLAGDEALLMAQETGVPVVVSARRSEAVRQLLATQGCDVVLADDGLQHYCLHRDMEVAVVDGVRRFGNGLCLPAGPLREPVARLQDCDFVVCQGNPEPGEYRMVLEGQTCRGVVDGTRTLPLSILSGQPVHVVTAIGNPTRFRDALQQSGLLCRLHAYPDHYRIRGPELRFEDDWPVLMTAKDAVKCRHLSGVAATVWYLPVRAILPPELTSAFLQRLKAVAGHSGDEING